MTDNDWRQLLFERLAGIEATMKPVPKALERIREVELEQARMKGGIRVLLWFIPAPTVVIGGLLIWSITTNSGIQ